jgi:hypothetical protein
VYGEGDDAQLGNDWAEGSHSHQCSCTQQQRQQQQQSIVLSPAATAGPVRSFWVQSLLLWWGQNRERIAAWLPSPAAAAAAADFAVGDEAQQHSTSTVQAAQSVLQQPHRTPEPHPATPTAMYRRLLSLSSMWGAVPDTTQPPQQQQQQQQRQESARLQGSIGSRCECASSAFAELQYNVYSLQDYDPVWEHYAYIYPVWVGDFGKNNMSASVNMSRQAKVRRQCQGRRLSASA